MGVGYARPYMSLYVPHVADTYGDQKSAPDLLELGSRCL